MKQEVIEQLEGYADIAREIEISAKFGEDFFKEKGTVERFINRLHPKRILVTVSEVIRETPSTKTFRLVNPAGPLPPFQAGQYVSLSIEVHGIRTSRAYSISSAPSMTGYYDLTVRRMEKGLVSNYLLDTVQPGERLVISGPGGTFHHNPIIHDDTLVLLGGGSGITPLMSMIRDTISRGVQRTLCLIYGNRAQEDVIFHGELLQIAERHPNFTYIPVLETPGHGYTGKTGYITGDLIREAVGEVAEKSFFICGPQAMYNFCLPELQKLGVPRRKIRKEMFGTPINIPAYPAWPEEVNCRLKVVSGKVYQPQETPVRKSDRQFGYVHGCVSYPLEDLEILVQNLS